MTVIETGPSTVHGDTTYHWSATDESDALSVPDGHDKAVVRGPGLWAVDLVDSPSVRSLDLSACAPGIHLAIRNCPGLQHVVVPPGGDGAVLHVDFGAAPPQLHVEGAVLDLDACWLPHGATSEEGIQAPAGRGRRGPLRGAWLGPITDEARTAELVLIVSDGDGGGGPVLSLDNGREVVAQGLGKIETMHVAGGRGGLALQVEGCPALASLSFRSDARRVRIERCPSLAEVKGSGHLITIADASSEVETLHLAGSWEQARLLYLRGPREVRADLADELALGACTGIERLRVIGGAEVVVFAGALPDVEGAADVRVEPLSERMLDEALESKDEETIRAIVTWCSTRKDPRAVLRALQLLRGIAASSHDPHQLWAARCGLHDRNTRHHRPKGVASDMCWMWQLPADLGLRGWTADVRIWLACRSAVPAARAFEGIIVSRSDPAHVAALARATRGMEGGGLDLLLCVLVRSLEHGAEHGGLVGRPRRDTVVPGVAPLDMDRINQVLQALVRHRGHPESPRVSAALCDWIVRRMPCAEGMHLLGAMRVMGSSPATAALEAVVIDAERFDEDTRRIALMQTLAPVRDSSLNLEPDATASTPSPEEDP